MFDDVTKFIPVSKDHNLSGVYRIVFEDGSDYIGSSKNIVGRISSHKSLLNKGRHPNRGMQELWDAGLSIKAEVIDFCRTGVLLSIEQSAISALDPKLNQRSALSYGSFEGFSKGWMAMGQDAALEIAKCRKELGGEGLAVFLYLVSHLDYNNSLIVPQAQIGEALGMKKQHVSRAMRKMAAMGVIIEGKKIGTMKTYRLSADYGWKGKAADHKKVLSHGFAILEEEKR